MKMRLIIAVMQATQAVVKLKPPQNSEQFTSIAEVMGLNPVRALIF